jgi:hypothetical protein
MGPLPHPAGAVNGPFKAGFPTASFEEVNKATPRRKQIAKANPPLNKAYRELIEGVIKVDVDLHWEKTVHAAHRDAAIRFAAGCSADGPKLRCLLGIARRLARRRLSPPPLTAEEVLDLLVDRALADRPVH